MYFHRHREHIDERFAMLHAQSVSLPSIDQYCLLAARIVEYPITWANYYPLNNSKHCVRLCHLLQSQRVLQSPEWRRATARNVLRWLLFAILVAPMLAHAEKSWALKVLQELIQERYGSEVWLMQEGEKALRAEIDNLCHFVWYRSALDQLVQKLWKEIRATADNLSTRNKAA